METPPPPRGLAGLASTFHGRGVIGLTTVVLIGVPFALTGRFTDPTTAHVLGTPLDDAIPFVPWSVYIYSRVYSSMLFPLFVVRDPRLYLRTAAAYLVLAALSLLVYWIYPVTSLGLRPDLSALDTTVFHNWGMRLTYEIDPPVNLFPSLHVGAALVSALAAYKARPLYGWVSAPIVVGICVTILTTKQHFVADGALAFLVVAVAWKLTLAPYRTDHLPLSERALTWRGPVGYLLFHGALYGGVYLVFLSVGDLW